MDNKYENERIFAEHILNFNHNLAEAQYYLKENFGIDSEYDEASGTLYLLNDDNVNDSVNEALAMATAREYVINYIGEDMIQVVYGK